MAVDANAVETYDNKVIREDLQEAYSMISPEEVPFQTLCGTRGADATSVDWPVVELAAVDGSNRVIEGDEAPDVDTGTLPLRFNNFTQISDKVAKVTHTSQAVNAAAENVQRMAKQVVLKMKEMKRDKEWMLLSNVVGSAGSSGTARQAAGFPAWLKTNTHGEAGSTDPAFSNGDIDGYPDTPAGDGTTPVALSEDVLNNVIELCWNEGAEPSIIMVNGGNKRVISATFTGNSTRYKDAIDGKLVAAIDIYDSDFGELTVVPNRFQPTLNAATDDDNYAVYVIDPEYVRIAYLDNVQQKPLAETGHAMSTLIWCEYTLQVDNEKAHGIIRDTTNAV